MQLTSSSDAHSTESASNTSSLQLPCEAKTLKAPDIGQPSSGEEVAKQSGTTSCLKLLSSEGEEKSPDRKYLEGLLNKSMKLKITDGRVLVGIFLCSDKDRNIILGSCQEHTKEPELSSEEPRILGLAMVPGKHITAMYVDQS